MSQPDLSSSTAPLRIWLDGRNVGRPEGTGVHHYALNHHNALQNLAFETAWLLENTEQAPPRAGIWRLLQALSAHVPNISAAFKSAWGKAYLIRDIYRIAHVHYRYYGRIIKLRPENPPTIMHWTYPLPILLEGCHNVVTIHDLIPLTHPHLTSINQKRFYSLVKDLADNDVHFVTVSETVREQIISIFGISEDRVTTLYQPVSFSNETRADIMAAPRIAPEGSFIFYGRVETRKNIERLLHAHAISGTHTPLVIIGPDGDDKIDFSSLPNKSKVIRLPWSQRLSLLRTLQEAKALLFPSLAEGFGLPIIEAMALGVPVLTSHGGVTEEISGNAALLCDPHDIHSIASSIKKLDALTIRERDIWREAGAKQANHFSALSYQERINNFYLSNAFS